jgi:alpha-L-fucosidase
MLSVTINLAAQHDEQKYYPESDPLVLEKLEKWQDLKFGMLMHWGPYSQWGIVESWSICPEDEPWSQRKKEGTPRTYHEYVTAYEKLQTTFNPVKFDPSKWAKAAKNAGMKYLVFTTKHHDGFCMFDTKYSDYKITDPKTPFSTNKKANISKEVFDAFRKEGLWVGAYFSKPDWHSEDYWWPYFPSKDRNVNYDPERYPEKWQKFVEFTHNQIMEILSDYGKIDILWLDGGWVRKQPRDLIIDFYKRRLDKTKTGFMNRTIVDQAIKMEELVKKAREKQPDLIVVDRAVEGKNQNYLTPENRVPEKPLPFPWESCIISGGGWSYNPKAKYMSGYKAIKILVDIVCKGGNLLLNFAPGPDGTLQDDAYRLLEEIGQWMDINSEAIYGTRAIAPFKEGRVCYTQKKNADTVYAIFMSEETETTIPSQIEVGSFIPAKDGIITLLGCNEELSWEKSANGILINIPAKIRTNPPSKYIWSFKIDKVRK